jgi:hypothetical protein
MTHEEATAGARFNRARDGDFEIITIRFPAVVSPESTIYHESVGIAAVERLFMFAAGVMAGGGLIGPGLVAELRAEIRHRFGT